MSTRTKLDPAQQLRSRFEHGDILVILLLRDLTQLEQRFELFQERLVVLFVVLIGTGISISISTS